MDRYRLISSIIVLFIYLLVMYPIPTIIVTVILLFAYFVFGGFPAIVNPEERERIRLRREALNNARLYLAPYSDIWRNLKLSNKYCSLNLSSTGAAIRGKELVYPYRTFRMPYNTDTFDIWNSFCNVFSYNTTFEELIRLCDIYNVSINIAENPESTHTQPETDILKTTGINLSSQNQITKNNNIKEKIDINNASEVEITSLPGISIVMSKKLIKRRDEVGGFKSVDEICQFLKLKPHIQKQLEELICIKKMKHSGKIKRYNERSIDL